ncbi:MAG: A/G-specific adenine glycosylase [Verrucomicrobia bacterium]|nr:A/G-specific adenine glycosylase [Verrucomicrobiota bacterium]
MPWRQNPTPYRVWISEAMLQQTRVETVVPYFLRWMDAFPNVTALADAPLETVLKTWEGLGYYARARNLHRAAIVVRDQYQGQIPDDPDLLGALPGIGPYTLAAIQSLAFGRPMAVLDGNVERVLSRVLASDAPINDPKVKNGLRDLAGRLMGDTDPRVFNEAMMELGATVCLPRNPRCTLCPLHPLCRGAKTDPTRFPVKLKKKKIPVVEVGAAVTWRDPETFLIAKRHPEGLLGGMWEFPGGKREANESLVDCVKRELQEELDIRVDVKDFFLHVRHTFTHFHLSMHVFHCKWNGDAPKALDCADFRWVRFADCVKLPFGKADRQVLAALSTLADNSILPIKFSQKNNH